MNIQSSTTSKRPLIATTTGALLIAMLLGGPVLAQDAATPQVTDAPASESVAGPSEAGGTLEGVGEFAEDSLITTKVKLELLADEQLSALDIKVETDEGVVHLEGEVASEAERERVIALVASIDGVRNINVDALQVN